MAKDQNLSLNPTKISGVCGRLMCCLKFENDLYCENCPRQNVSLRPKQGSRVIVAEGEGKVIAVSFSRRNATILLDTNKTIVAGWEDILPVNAEDMEPADENILATDEEIAAIDVPPAELQPENQSPAKLERQEKFVRHEKPARFERPAKIEQPERPRRTEIFNRRYNRTENFERDNRNDRAVKPRGDKTRRQPRRDPKK